jgi:hypothetical protein
VARRLAHKHHLLVISNTDQQLLDKPMAIRDE